MERRRDSVESRLPWIIKLYFVSCYQ